MKCRSKYRTGLLWGIPCPPIDPNKYVLLWTDRWTTSKWVSLAYCFVYHPFGQGRTKITLLQCLSNLCCAQTFLGRFSMPFPINHRHERSRDGSMHCKRPCVYMGCHPRTFSYETFGQQLQESVWYEPHTCPVSIVIPRIRYTTTARPL